MLVERMNVVMCWLMDGGQFSCWRMMDESMMVADIVEFVLLECVVFGKKGWNNSV